jgi:ABC-2 type transport system permease protein
MWVRDPLRLTFLVIAAIIGLGVCAVPELSQGTGFLLPFAGILSAIIAGAGACNLYGSDGLALRLTLMVPGAERADVRGRQAAFLLLVGPYALVATVALTAISGQAWAWAWVLALLPAIVGGAAGLLPIASLVAVLPLDANGGPAPAWPVKVYAAMVLTLVAAAPTAAVLIVGAFAGSVATQWAAVPVGVASGVLAAVLLGRAATVRLGRRGVAIVEQLSAA